ncbi:hypothetical protein [Paenibacillus sp. FSL R7-0272]|uniref:hypothetical protein n=1 Tax=Paenibacillus sp. FSL R7-0272 TaxID=2921679 RepID=UPI0030ED1EE9
MPAWLAAHSHQRKTGSEPAHPPRSSSHAVEEHQSTNAFSKQTENIAVYNVDKEAELKEKDRLLSLAMERLSSVKREIINRGYLDNEGGSIT